MTKDTADQPRIEKATELQLMVHLSRAAGTQIELRCIPKQNPRKQENVRRNTQELTHG